MLWFLFDRHAYISASIRDMSQVLSSESRPTRLINIHTLELKEFGSAVPDYAILSHRWTACETTFEDCQRIDTGRKVRDFCYFVRRREVAGLHWAWVDTCCINKSSSAELSEAINSMAAWYKNAAFCVAYLHDVVNWATDFRHSEWFQRGWTLQELLFSEELVFCNRDWIPFARIGAGWGSSAADARLVSEITGIEIGCITSKVDILRQSIATRMSWAAKRRTTRIEDQAYCLLGLFDVNMPLIYGEGSRAFFRLQEELIRRFDDDSIFMWQGSNLLSVLAPSPAPFVSGIETASGQRKPYRMTAKGIEFVAPSIQLGDIHVIQLNCCSASSSGSRLEPCLLVLQTAWNGLSYKLDMTWDKAVTLSDHAVLLPEQTFFLGVNNFNDFNPAIMRPEALAEEVATLSARFRTFILDPRCKEVRLMVGSSEYSMVHLPKRHDSGIRLSVSSPDFSK